MVRAPRIPGIREKLLLAFSLLVAGIAVFVFVFFPARLRDQALRAVEAKAAAIRDMSAYTVSAGMFFGDTAAVREVVAGVMRDPTIAFLTVRDSAGRLVASAGPRPRGIVGIALADSDGVTADARAYVTSVPVLHGTSRLGRLTVGVSLVDLRDEVAQARRLGALVGLLIFVIGFGIVFAISSLVTRPLSATARTMDRIAAGDFSLRAVPAADREVNQLVAAFNGMVDSLVAAQAQLAQANQGLEVRVDARTAELRAAIVEQQNVQRALEQSESAARATSETLQTFIDVAPQAIVAVDLSWRVTRWNKAAEKLFGWSEREVLGQPIPYIPEGQAPDFRSFQASVEAGEPVPATEAVRTRKDGSRVDVLVAATMLRAPDQRVIGYISIVSDLTDRKHLEQQLRQSQKMEAIGRLAGGVAHDFNNLLTVIASYSALLLEAETLSRTDREDLEQIQAAGARAAALTRQLLTFSRKEIVQMVEVDVNAILQGMGPMLRRLLRENVEYTTVLGGDTGIITADPTQIEQVIMNLVINASDALPNGGTLKVATHSTTLDAANLRAQPDVRPGPFVQLSVCDNGTGMDAATIAKIFEPFFTTKDIGRGTGLGLATTYAIVTRLGGFIDVTSKLGHGTTFTISIPRTASVTSAASAVSAAENEAAAAGGAVVLLVEDESGVRRVLRSGLERGGFKVIEAVDAEAALAIASAPTCHFDAMVTDLMMPGMNGRALSDLMKARHPGIKVVFMSGYADETVDRRNLTDHDHVFMQKPFSAAQLRAQLHELLNPAPARESAP